MTKQKVYKIRTRECVWLCSMWGRPSAHGWLRIDKLKLIEIQFKLLIAFSAHFLDLWSSKRKTREACWGKKFLLKHLKNESGQWSVDGMTRLFLTFCDFLLSSVGTLFVVDGRISLIIYVFALMILFLKHCFSFCSICSILSVYTYQLLTYIGMQPHTDTSRKQMHWSSSVRNHHIMRIIIGQLNLNHSN